MDICILPFMVEKLHLSANELIVYALIHGINKNGKKYCESMEETSKKINVSYRNTIRIFHRLIEKGLLNRYDNVIIHEGDEYFRWDKKVTGYVVQYLF